MKINCIIVEDEPLAAVRAAEYAGRLPHLHLAATFDNAFDALAYINRHAVGLLFLDIHLGAFSGIQLLETTTVKCPVILTTAYAEYALKSYDLKVADYLLKPYTFERFVQAVDRALTSVVSYESTPDKRFLFVKTEHRLEKIMMDDMLYIEGMGDYRRIHTRHKRIMTLQTFAEFEKEIDPSTVCRIHKSYMVAIDKIDAIEKDRVLVNGVLLPVSDHYKQAFYRIIEGRGA